MKNIFHRKAGLVDRIRHELNPDKVVDDLKKRIEKPELASFIMMAIGAMAAGAVAYGFFSVGRMAIGKLAVNKGRFGTLEIDTLRIRNLEIAAGPKAQAAEEF